MARFTRAQLESFNGALVDDLVGGRVRLLFVGINPGLWTAAVNAHFARRGNRFWPALHAAGITPYEVDASDGMRADDLAMLAALGVAVGTGVMLPPPCCTTEVTSALIDRPASLWMRASIGQGSSGSPVNVRLT